MIEYRRFRNSDPPGLAEIWNEALTGRGAVRLRTSSPLERFVFSKIFFDPEGLIVAVENGRSVGFVHAGFGANAGGSALDMQAGVTCMIAVRQQYQRRGIGTELLQRAEAYLRGRGAVRLFAGPRAPLNPYYFGLYGGSEACGFLVSDAAAEPFFTRRGYQVSDTVTVMQRQLSVAIKVFDARFFGFRQRLEFQEDVAARLESWWQYNVYNGTEPRVFALMDKSTNQPGAQAALWEMEGFAGRWNLPAVVGLVDWWVRPDLRRQGIGKYLLVQIMRKAQEDLLEVMEVSIPSNNEAAQQLCKGLGFTQVDLGKVYQRRD